MARTSNKSPTCNQRVGDRIDSQREDAAQVSPTLLKWGHFFLLCCGFLLSSSLSLPVNDWTPVWPQAKAHNSFVGQEIVPRVVKSRNREMNNGGEGDDGAPLWLCLVSDGWDLQRVYRPNLEITCGKGGKCHGSQNPRFKGMQVHKLQWEEPGAGEWRSTYSAFLKDGDTSLLHSILHVFDLGFLLLTPLHPKAIFNYLTGGTPRRSLCFSCSLLRHWGFILQIQPELNLPFQSTRHLLPWKRTLGSEGDYAGPLGAVILERTL